MKISPAHEFIQFRNFATRMHFALDDEMRESLSEQQSARGGFDLFVRLINQYRIIENTMKGRDRNRNRGTLWVP